MDAKAELLKLLQKNLALEHAAYIQYLNHSAVVFGSCSQGIISQLNDSAKDESDHANILRALIANYIDSYPTGEVAEVHKATSVDKILSVNEADEQTAIDSYNKTLQLIRENPNIEFYETFYTSIRDILVEEEKHLIELRVLRD
jgi:bacterioferritin